MSSAWVAVETIVLLTVIRKINSSLALSLALGGLMALAAAYVSERVANSGAHCEGCIGLVPSAAWGIVAGAFSADLLMTHGYKALGMTLASVAVYPVALCALVALFDSVDDDRPGRRPPIALGAGVSPLLAFPVLLAWTTLLAEWEAAFFAATSLCGWAVAGVRGLGCHE